MTNDNEKPTGNDRQYPVTEVAGHPPVDLEDFVGATTVTVQSQDAEYRLVGAGARDDDVVVFQQKEVDSAADDGATWTILENGRGDIVAEPDASD